MDDVEQSALGPKMAGDDVAKTVNQRLVAWMVDLILEDIKKLVSWRCCFSNGLFVDTFLNLSVLMPDLEESRPQAARDHGEQQQLDV